MHEACLKPFNPKPPPEVQATTFINRIFGGKLRSRVSPATVRDSPGVHHFSGDG
jgi:hypothetical protein